MSFALLTSQRILSPTLSGSPISYLVAIFQLQNFQSSNGGAEKGCEMGPGSQSQERLGFRPDLFHKRLNPQIEVG